MITQHDIKAKISNIPSIPHVVAQALELCENYHKALALVNL